MILEEIEALWVSPSSMQSQGLQECLATQASQDELPAVIACWVGHIYITHEWPYI